MTEYKTESQKKKFYKLAAWSGVNGIRIQALKRDNYECQQCKAEGKVHIDSIKVEGERKSIQLNVHHIKDIETYPELALDLDNTETVCLDHHNKEHKRFQPSTNKWVYDEKW